MAMHSLSSRITLTVVTLVALAILVAGVAAVQLVRAATQDEARSEIRAQAELLAALPSGLADPAVQRRLAENLDGSTLSFISADGTVAGDAARYTGIDRIVGRVLDGHEVSTASAESGLPLLVEARPASGGGGVILSTPRDVDVPWGRQFVQRLMVALGIALLAAIVAAALLARALSRPLRLAAAAAHRMASGERGVAIPATSVTEVAAVTSALGALDASLAASESRQRDFLQSVSHELRTPLTAIRGYSEALVDGVIQPADMASVGRTLVDATARAGAFVADLLELSRLEADDFSVDRAEVDVAALIDALQTTWTTLASAAGVALTVDSAEPAIITTDRRRLLQILEGLLGNAIRLTPTGGRVVLAHHADASEFRFEVRDSGPGLTPDDVAVAFQPGVLAERYRGSRPVGTGLGLAIAARLARRLGGELSISTAPEGGAAFLLRLPRRVGRTPDVRG